MGAAHPVASGVSQWWALLGNPLVVLNVWGREAGIDPVLRRCLGFPGGPAVKNLPATQEVRASSLGWVDPLEEGRTNHSSLLAWRLPRTEEPGGLQSVGL